MLTCSINQRIDKSDSNKVLQSYILSVFHRRQCIHNSDSSDEDDRRGDVDMLVDHSDDSSDESSDEEETTHNVTTNKNPWMSSSKLLLLSLPEIVS